MLIDSDVELKKFMVGALYLNFYRQIFFSDVGCKEKKNLSYVKKS
jgi:hypothetical protein